MMTRLPGSWKSVGNHTWHARESGFRRAPLLPRQMGYRNEYLGGPASKHLKGLRRDLVRVGVEEKEMPRILQDPVVKRSKKGPIGAIVVRNMSGIEPNTAHKMVKRFEQNITGGTEDICEKLEAIHDELKPEEIRLLELLRKPHKKTLSHLMAEAGVEPTKIMSAYARGAVYLGKLEAAIAAHAGLPHVIRDLVRHAVDGTGVCMVCVGSGTVRQRVRDKGPELPCPQCQGNGKSLVSSKHKEFAVQKLLEATKIISKDPLVTVQQNTQINTGGSGGGFFEKMLEVSDAILYPAKERIVEAEVIKSE